MKFQPSHCDLIRAALGDAAALERFRQGHPDWLRIPYLWTRLLPEVAAQHGLLSHEAKVVEGLRHTHQRELATLDQAAAGALDCLQKAGIRALLLKGQAVRSYYDSPWQRPMGDVDILITYASLEPASRALEGRGWQRQRPLPQAAQVCHAIAFAHPSGASLDLHWYALESCRWFNADAAFWKSSEGHRLNPSHLFLHVCLHGTLSGWSGQWVIDAARIVKQETLDWVEILEEGRRRKLLPLLAGCLTQLRRDFDLPVPTPPEVGLDLYTWCKFNGSRGLSRLMLPWVEYRRFGGRSWLGFVTFLRQRWDLPSRGQVWTQICQRWRRRYPASRPPAPSFSLQDVERFWSRDYQEAQAIIHPFHDDPQWVEAVLRELFSPAVSRMDLCNALEIGCGMGRILLSLVDRVPHLTGVDISPRMVEHSRTFLQAHPRIQVLLGDGRHLPVADHSQDFVY